MLTRTMIDSIDCKLCKRMSDLYIKKNVNDFFVHQKLFLFFCFYFMRFVFSSKIRSELIDNKISPICVN